MHETVLSLTQRAKANSIVSESGEADASLASVSVESAVRGVGSNI